MPFLADIHLFSSNNIQKYC